MPIMSSRGKSYRFNIDKNCFVLVRNNPIERSTEFFQNPDTLLFKLNRWIEKDRDQLKRYLNAFDAGVRYGRRLKHQRLSKKSGEVENG